MIQQNRSKWGPGLGRLLKANNYDGRRSLGLLGLVMEKQLRSSVIALTAPPLSPVTLMLRMMRIGRVNDRVTFAMVLEARARVARGEVAAGVSAKPLIDSGYMLSRISSEVANK